MKILFLGGRRILGNALLNEFLKIKRVKIYLIYRGAITPGFRKKDKYKIILLNFDRNDIQNLKKKISDIKFDIILDNNCYDMNSYRNLINLVKYNTFIYIFTSSIVSYLSFPKIIAEKDSFKKIFKNKIHPEINNKISLNKRLIENALHKQKRFKFCILKIHNIIGPNDHSNKTIFLKKFNQSNLKSMNIKTNEFLQFAYLPDIVRIYSKLLNRIANKKKIYNVYNIANNKISYQNLLNIKNKLKFKNYPNFKIKKKPIIQNLIVSNLRIRRSFKFKFTSLKNVLIKVDKIRN